MIQLIVKRRSRPRNWDRVRVMPGLYGRIVGHVGDHRYMVDVLVSELAAALHKRPAPKGEP